MTDLGKVIPEHGGRVQLELTRAGETGASYHVTLSGQGGTWVGRLHVTADGTIDGDVEGSPPVWLDAFARALLRTLFRQHEHTGWPRRVTRWRPGYGGCP